MYQDSAILNPFHGTAPWSHPLCCRWEGNKLHKRHQMQLEVHPLGEALVQTKTHFNSAATVTGGHRDRARPQDCAHQRDIILLSHVCWIESFGTKPFPTLTYLLLGLGAIAQGSAQGFLLAQSSGPATGRVGTLYTARNQTRAAKCKASTLALCHSSSPIFHCQVQSIVYLLQLPSEQSAVTPGD